ncbi:MAG: hypothetical protein K0R26_1968 [Bacteroidota bacterium]|jgi:hypothetical protein|nr:hypothetical protein [Bacteroidota bacterium]
MDYIFKEYSIKEIYDLVENKQIDLNPSYQRNFIWSPDNQNELIDTILKGYPLPSFFLYKKPDGKFEMVDGQQRTTTIYRFIQGLITSSKAFNKINFKDIDQKKFLEYNIPVIEITKLATEDSLKEFYVLINKKGVHLNPAEVNKSEFHDTNFLKLSSDLLSYQNLINLNLFSESTSRRMNDRAFIEELLAYLISGVKDKKKSVEVVFKDDISEEEYRLLDSKFKQIIDKIEILNSIEPLSQTRYKQKNDFFTLFSFINENLNEDINTLKYQYRILLVLDGVDNEGRQIIRPSNEDSAALKEYANNCITQSNSKKARENRLNFFNSILKNKSTANNETFSDVLGYLSLLLGNEKVKLKKIDEFELLDVERLK